MHLIEWIRIEYNFESLALIKNRMIENLIFCTLKLQFKFLIFSLLHYSVLRCTNFWLPLNKNSSFVYEHHCLRWDHHASILMESLSIVMIFEGFTMPPWIFWIHHATVFGRIALDHHNARCSSHTSRIIERTSFASLGEANNEVWMLGAFKPRWGYHWSMNDQTFENLVRLLLKIEGWTSQALVRLLRKLE